MEWFDEIILDLTDLLSKKPRKLLDKIHQNRPQWASDPLRPAIEAQNRPTNLRGQEAEPRVFALLQKKYLSSSTENPNFRSINLGLTYTFLVLRNILVHCPFYFNAKITLWKTYLEVTNTKEVNLHTPVISQGFLSSIPFF